MNIKINDKKIGENEKPFVIAEAGVNYYEIAGERGISLIKAAEKMIEKAVEGGADAIKFQTYKAEKIAIEKSPAYWDTETTQREFFKKYDKFGREEFRKLAEYAENNKIVFLSTPFDKEAVDFLNDLVPAFKIASADITNFPLLRYIGGKKKPVFLSTGASNTEEIKNAVNVLEESGSSQIVINHCILSYPTDYSNANLNMIEYLKETFPEYLIGYSDHTVPDSEMLVLTMAAILGATVIEKHFTLNKSLPGNDHYHAMDYDDLKKFSNNIELIRKVGGINIKKPIEEEKESRTYARRSIVSKIFIEKDMTITAEMLTQKRPGTGLSPVFQEKIVGRKAVVDIPADTLIELEMID